MDKLVVTAKKELLERKKKIKAKNNEFIGTSKSSLSIYVTPKLIQRALKFMDNLIGSLKQKSYQIGFKEYYGTIVIIEGIEINIRLREKCRRIKKDDNLWSTSELEPIGKLVFTVDTYPRKEWEDSDHKLLDLKIPNIVNYLEEKAKEEVAYEIARKKRNEELEILKTKEAELRCKQEVEEKRFYDLLKDCERWHQAQRLRGYINAVKTHANTNSNMSTDLSNWLDWANEKVKEIDPI